MWIRSRLRCTLLHRRSPWQLLKRQSSARSCDGASAVKAAPRGSRQSALSCNLRFHPERCSCPRGALLFPLMNLLLKYRWQLSSQPNHSLPQFKVLLQRFSPLLRAETAIPLQFPAIKSRVERPVRRTVQLFCRHAVDRHLLPFFLKDRLRKLVPGAETAVCRMIGTAAALLEKCFNCQGKIVCPCR